LQLLLSSAEIFVQFFDIFLPRQNRTELIYDPARLARILMKKIYNGHGNGLYREDNGYMVIRDHNIPGIKGSPYMEQARPSILYAIQAAVFSIKTDSSYAYPSFMLNNFISTFFNCV